MNIVLSLLNFFFGIITIYIGMQIYSKKNYSLLSFYTKNNIRDEAAFCRQFGIAALVAGIYCTVLGLTGFLERDIIKLVLKDIALLVIWMAVIYNADAKYKK